MIYVLPNKNASIGAICENVYSQCGFCDLSISLEEYIDQVVIVVPCPGVDCGVVFAETFNDQYIVDGSMYLQGIGPRYIDVYNALKLLRNLGYKYMYATTFNSTNQAMCNKYCKKLGLQKIDTNVFSVELEG